MKALSYLKKTFVIVVLMLLAQMAHAQSYIKINYTIDSLLTLGLPKSALAEVDKLDAMARKDNNVPQQVHAAIYRMMFLSYIEENSLLAIINRLKTDIDKAGYPVKPILRSVLAGMYYNYYERNRWQIHNRTRLEKPSADVTRWDLQTLIDEASRMYKLSLQDARLEQNTSLDILEGALKGDPKTRYLRPTLYDLLVHRALSFFLMDEPALTKPKMPFSVNDARFFSDGRSFAALQVNTTDTTSTYYIGIKLLQQATLFHLENHHDEALADLDITRLQFLFGKATMPAKDSLYVNALKGIADRYGNKPISADALLALGKYYQQKNELKTALVYLHQAITNYPKSWGGINAAVVAAEIEQRSISAVVENVNLPGIPLLGNISYRNVKEAKLSVYHLTSQQYKYYRDKITPHETLAKRTADLLNNVQPQQQKILQLPDPHDYSDHHTEFKIDPLSVGNYIIRVEDTQAGTDSTLIAISELKVSGLAFVARENPNSTAELRVMDRRTGQPLEGVTVKAFDTQGGLISSGRTNKQGRYAPNIAKRVNVAFSLMFKGDTIDNAYSYLYGATYDPDKENNDDDNKTILFTDRQIYRPGQTIYFKGLQLSIRDHKAAISNKDSVEVYLEDANGKDQASLSFLPNEFGTFAGKFVIPQNVLPGRCRIKTIDGDVSIRIEEYKRPTFKAEFLPVRASYKLNDTVTVKGKAMALSGYGLSQAQVAYHITRIKTSPYNYYGGYGYNNTEIKADTINTDSQGNFSIKFKAIPGDDADFNSAVYSYDISVNVTDAAGESHSASTSVKVGNNNIAVKAYLPADVLAKDTNKIAVHINNLNGQPQKGSVTVQVYALQNPGRLFKNRLWPKPDQYLLSRQEYRANFPDYAYDNEEDPHHWQRLDQVSSATIAITDTDRYSYFNINGLRKQRTGIYQVVISAKNLAGDTTSVTNYVRLITNDPIPAKMTDWVTVGLNAVPAGTPAQFAVGIDQPVHVLMEKYDGPELVSSNWMNIEAGQHTIKVPTTKTDSDISVQFLMVYQNRAYASYQKIYLQKPDNKLNIKFITHRDKLQPGDKEQWKLQVSSHGNEKEAAEMVASLYDASLDEISPPESWANITDQPRRYHGNYYNWSVYNFVRMENTVPLIYRYLRYDQIPRDHETLDMMGYDYYGGHNYGFYNYLNQASRRMATAKSDIDIEASYKRNAAQIKDGVDVIGKLVDGSGFALPGVSINIKGTSIFTNSNSLGYFKIKVPVNGVLKFNFIGFNAREVTITKTSQNLNITLTANSAALNEVVVVGYGSQKRSDLTGSVAAVSTLAGVKQPAALYDTLEGKLAGIAITSSSGNPGGDAMIAIRGASSIGSANSPLYVIDGVLMDNAINILPADVISIDILKDASATALYGSRAAHGVVIVTTKANKAAQQAITTRKNFNETAFFYPQLHTDSKGEILIDFTIPEALTRWRFKAFAHTKDLNTGYLESEVLTQKQLSITATTPRFLREGDSITISARLANLTNAPLTGQVKLQLFNAVTMQPVDLLVNAADAQQNFNMQPSSTRAVSFKMFIPFGIDAVTYRLTAASGAFTDGEENTMPVLPNRMLVTESMPMMVRSGQTRAFTFDKLVNQSSTTLKNKTLTLEYTQNPAWYAVQALPYMMEFPYECSEQTFSRYYANSLGTNLVNKMPVIKQIFDQWRTGNSPELLSNLEKDQELKATLLEETPWLRDAASETERKKRVALLFDLEKMSYQLRATLDKLKQKQLPDGGFPWFAGDISDAYITRHILAGMGQLYHLGIVDTKNEVLKSIADKAMAYLDDVLLRDAEYAKQHKVYDVRHITSAEIHSYYTQSYFTARTLKPEVKALVDNYLALAEKQWLSEDIYEQGMIALTMLRNNKADVAQKIIRSLTERAQSTDDMGMYWAKNTWGYYWYQSPVETQSLMIELFTEAGGQDKAVEEMKIWLLRNKQTNDWKTTKATAAACYALLLKGDNWLADKGTSNIELDNHPLTELKPGLKAEPGTGYIKTNWADDAVKPAMGKVSITNNGKSVSWGAMHWQYLENLDKITPSSTDIHIERKYFITKQTDRGTVLVAIDAAHKPKPGDMLKVVVYLKAGRDYEYVQLKDMRPAGTEPADALSRYKYQDGLYYYQVTKDVATNFFISRLNKGNYVFEYQLRVAQPGNFSTGISTVQCMYAPEFNAHSEGMRLTVDQ